jgi:putative transport protein
LARDRHWRVIFGRIKRGDRIMLFRPEVRLQPGDLITMVGDNEEAPQVAAFLGERSQVELHLDHSVLDFRRLFVSNRQAVGRTLAQLHLPQRYGAIVTRVRRGDVEFLPSRNTVLELGDRVRVLAPRERIPDITKYFGDSYSTLAEIDVLSFGIGIAAGLLLGLIAVPLPLGGEFRLGLAGGPLLVGLLLGTRGRTGPFIWQLPHSANLTLRQIGLVLFLAGIGTRAGDAFFATMRGGKGLMLMAPGMVVTFTVSLLALIVGYKLLRIPMGVLVGMVAAMHTQPATLAFAHEQAKHDLPNLGYATVYPISTVMKILLAPLLLTLAS